MSGQSTPPIRERFANQTTDSNAAHPEETAGPSRQQQQVATPDLPAAATDVGPANQTAPPQQQQPQQEQPPDELPHQQVPPTIQQLLIASAGQEPVRAIRLGQNQDPVVSSGSSLYYTLFDSSGQLETTAQDGRPICILLPGPNLPDLEQAPGDPIERGPSRRTTRRRVPRDLRFVPHTDSLLERNILYDLESPWAWPIWPINVLGPNRNIPDPLRAHVFAGPPFHLQTYANDHGVGQARRRGQVRRFVDQLDQADAELRARMARVGVADIGLFADDAEEGGKQNIGCPICYDSYDDHDTPEWLGGEQARQEQVVVAPCRGSHTFHRRCLEACLMRTSMKDWECPLDRDSLDPSKFVSGSAPRNDAGRRSSRPTQQAMADELRVRRARLVDRIRKLEKERGYRCDSPACLPDYETPQDEAPLERQLVKLSPCGHEVHPECLAIASRVRDGGVINAAKAEEAESDSGETDEDGGGESVKMKGQWVECPVDGKEMWVMIPVAKKRKIEDPEPSTIESPTANVNKPLPSPSSGQVDQDATSTSPSSNSTFPVHGARERMRLADLARAARVDDGASEDEM